eukprot:4289733-Heterocapsa_arctica.AAC.1
MAARAQGPERQALGQGSKGEDEGVMRPAWPRASAIPSRCRRAAENAGKRNSTNPKPFDQVRHAQAWPGPRHSLRLARFNPCPLSMQNVPAAARSGQAGNQPEPPGRQAGAEVREGPD